tara:strand:- start:15826 stop:17289 length:1464 start_codon:yes stop_codon:yes gene_type:complete
MAKSKEDLLAIFKLTQMATDLGNTFATMNNANNAIALQQQKMDYANQLKKENAADTLNLTSRRNANSDKLKEINNLIQDNYSKLERSDILRSDLEHVGIFAQTDEFKKLLDENEATLTKDLSFTSQTADTFAENQNRIEFEIDTKEKIYNNLNDVLDKLSNNKEHMMQIGTEAGLNPFLKESEDIMAYVNLPENRALFKEKDYLRNELGDILVDANGMPIISKTGDGYTDKNNYLVKDLLQETRRFQGVDYGSKPTYIQAQVDAKTNIVRNKDKTRTYFDDIDNFLDQLVKSGDYNEAELAEINLGNFKTNFKGTVDNYLDPNANMVLKDNLGKSIIQLIKQSDNFDKMEFADGSSHKNQILAASGSQELTDNYIMKLIKESIVGKAQVDGDGDYIKDNNSFVFGDVDGDYSMFNKDYEDYGPVFQEGFFWRDEGLTATRRGEHFNDELLSKLMKFYLHTDKNLFDLGYQSLGRSMYLDPTFNPIGQ